MTSWPSSWTRKVVVTGASGFVGGRLVGHLRSKQLDVLALSRRPLVGDPSSLAVDYGNREQLVHAFTGASVVMHLAARAHRKDDADAAAAYDQANVHNTRCIAEACVVAGVQRLVFVSSIGVHGHRSAEVPFSETDTPQPSEPYAISKLKAERMLSTLLADSSTDSVILRPPLVYGAGCPGNFRLLLALASRAPLVPLASVTAPRRFVYVGNLVDALYVAAHHPAASRRTFVIGDGRDLTVAEIARAAAAHSGRPAWVVVHVHPLVLGVLARIAGKREAFAKLTAKLQVDPRAFTQATGWSPPFDPSEGLREAVLAMRSDRQH